MGRLNERNRRIERHRTERWVTVGDSDPVLVPAVGHEESVFDYDCPACGSEHTARGVIGALRAYLTEWGEGCPEGEK